MEQATLLKIAQFRTLAARKGKVFDVVRFASDRQFASQTLTQVLADADEELLMAGLALMDLLGMTQQPSRAAGSPRQAGPAAAAAAAPPASSSSSSPSSDPPSGPPSDPSSDPSSGPSPAPPSPRYVGRLR